MNQQTNQMTEMIAECCGCGIPVPNAEDFGNNADVAETCCKTCFEAELARREQEEIRKTETKVSTPAVAGIVVDE